MFYRNICVPFEGTLVLVSSKTSFLVTWRRSCLSVVLKSSKEPCERLDSCLWPTNLMAGVVEMVCFVVECKTGVLLNNFEFFWNVSCLSDFSGVWHILNFTVIFCFVSFNFFDGTCSRAWFLRMRARRFGGSDFKSDIYVHFSFERFFSWVRVEVVPTVWCSFSEWFPPN